MRTAVAMKYSSHEGRRGNLPRGLRDQVDRACSWLRSSVAVRTLDTRAAAGQSSSPCCASASPSCSIRCRPTIPTRSTAAGTCASSTGSWATTPGSSARCPPLLRAGERVLELGAGTGEMALGLGAARHPGGRPRPLAAPRGLAGRPGLAHGRPARRSRSSSGYPVVIGNLIFHQFTDAELAALGARLRQGGARHPRKRAGAPPDVAGRHRGARPASSAPAT